MTQDSDDNKLVQKLTSSLELAKRISQPSDLDDLYFSLVNDIRSIMDYDRSQLILHFGNRSKPVAISDQVSIKTESRHFEEIQKLGNSIREVSDGVFLSLEKLGDDETFAGLTKNVKGSIEQYARYSEAQYIFIVPLAQSYEDPVAHLVFEFFMESAPEKYQVLTVLNCAPIFAMALCDRYARSKAPHLMSRITPGGSQNKSVLGIRILSWKMFLILGILSLVTISFLKLDFKVGGPAVIEPYKRHYAFCKIDGLIDQVFVKDGSRVEKNEKLARLDARELEFEIESAANNLKALSSRAESLSYEADRNLGKLSEARLIKLRMKKVKKELEYLIWKKRFLIIRAPTAGVVSGNDIESLLGKRLANGAAFCEIIDPDDLVTIVYVPENRISEVKIGMPLDLYLNRAPLTRLSMSVDFVSTQAWTHPKYGNTFKVKGRIAHTEDAKVGMKGVGKIIIGPKTIGKIVINRLAESWNYLTLGL